jgi:hypothetical protein
MLTGVRSPDFEEDGDARSAAAGGEWSSVVQEFCAGRAAQRRSLLAPFDWTAARLYTVAFAAFAVAWLILCSPWLGGELTIPYDAKAHFQAQLQFLANALHSGQSPFWAPNVFEGSPQVADPQSLIFSPAFLIAYFNAAPSFAVVDLYVLAMLGCAGVAVIAFFYDRGWHPTGAVVAALAFAFGASAAWRIQHIGQIQSYALFPVALWLLDRAMTRTSVVWGTAAGLSIGLMIVEPNQVALLAAYVLAGFVAARMLERGTPRPALRRLAAPVGAAAAVAVLLASVPILLTYLFVEDSVRPVIPFAQAARGSLHPASLLTAVVGDLYGALDPKVEYWGPYSVAWDPSNSTLTQNMGQLYVGILPVMLLLTVGLIRGVALAREIRFFTCALLTMVIYGLGIFTPAFSAIYAYVPGVDLFRRPADATFLIGGLMAFLGGYLVHRVVEGTAPPASPARCIAEGVALAVPFAAGVAVALRLGHVTDAVKPVVVAAACLLAAGAALYAIDKAGPRHALGCLMGIAALTTLDLRVNNGPNESTALPVAGFEFLKPNCTNETISFLKARLKQPLPSSRRDRVELVGLGFSWPNAGLVHGFDHDLGYNPLRLGPIAEATGAGETIAGWDQRRFTPLFPSYRSLLADLLGLRYIATPIPVERIDKRLRPGDLVQIARTKEAYIYENPRAFPRVMLVRHWMRADFNELMATGAWPKFDPARTLLLEQAPPSSADAPDTPGEAPGVATIVHFENTIVEVEATAPAGGFVLVNSAWHPWWRASVDGKPASVLKANVLFRAVQVPAGRHRVRFEFEPIAGAMAEIARSVRKPDLIGRKAQSRRERPPARVPIL